MPKNQVYRISIIIFTLFEIYSAYELCKIVEFQFKIILLFITIFVIFLNIQIFKLTK